MAYRRHLVLFSTFLVTLLTMTAVTSSNQHGQAASTDRGSTSGEVDELAFSTARVTGAVRRWARVEQVKRGILSQLGLDQAPTDRNATPAADSDDSVGGQVLSTYRRCIKQMAEHPSELGTSDGNDVTYSEDVSEDVHETESSHAHAKKFSSFTAQPDGNCLENGDSNEYSIRFAINIPEAGVQRGYVMSATLRLRMRHLAAYGRNANDSTPPQPTLVNIYHLVQRTHRRHGYENNANSTVERRLVTSRVLAQQHRDRRRQWEEFDVTPAVEAMFESGLVGGSLDLLSLGVTVTGRRRPGRLVLGGTGCRRGNGSVTGHLIRHRPVLNILTTESPPSDSHDDDSVGGNRLTRPRRAASRHGSTIRLPTAPTSPDPVCTAEDDETRCCRRSLWISFSEIGWDSWIVEPSGYQAYYCDGSCPPGHLPAHNYATVRQLLLAAGSAPGRSGNGRPGWPPLREPVCGATRLSSLPLVLRIDGRQMVAVFENMIVDQCRCI